MDHIKMKNICLPKEPTKRKKREAQCRKRSVQYIINSCYKSTREGLIVKQARDFNRDFRKVLI